MLPPDLGQKLPRHARDPSKDHVLGAGLSTKKETVVPMRSTSSPVRPPQPVTLEAVQVDAAEGQPPNALSRLRDRALRLRLFGIGVLKYLTNYVVAYVPSFTLRRLWYRRVLESSSIRVPACTWARSCGSTVHARSAETRCGSARTRGSVAAARLMSVAG